MVFIFQVENDAGCFGKCDNVKKFRNEDPVASGKGQLKYNKQVNILLFRTSLVRKNQLKRALEN